MFNPFPFLKKVVVAAVAKPVQALAGSAQDSIERKLVSSVIRKIAIALATYLVHQGYIDASVSVVVVGALIALASVAAGSIEKVQKAGS